MWLDYILHLRDHTSRIGSVARDMDTFGCKQADRFVEYVHPFTCVALIVMSPTPRVVQNKWTALMYAVYKKNDAMVTALLDHNANPDIQDDVSQGPQ